MKHLEVKDLWLQQEVIKGVVQVFKVLGTENPSDLMTKIVSVADIESRLKKMSIRIKWLLQGVPGEVSA